MKDLEIRATQVSERIQDRFVLFPDILFSTRVPESDFQLQAVNEAAKRDGAVGGARIVGCDLLKERNFTGNDAKLDMRYNPVLVLNIDASKTLWPTRAIIESFNSMKGSGVLQQASAVVIGRVIFPDKPIIKEADADPFKEGFGNFVRNTFKEYGLEGIPVLQMTGDNSLPEGRFRQKDGGVLTLGSAPCLTGIAASVSQHVVSDPLYGHRPR